MLKSRSPARNVLSMSFCESSDEARLELLRSLIDL
jgi:hypothetical protein